MNRTIVTAAALLLSTASFAEDKISAQEDNNCLPPMNESLRGDAVNGKALHIKNCVACHGEDGKADVVVMHMDETPEDQSDPEYMSTLNDAFLYLAICKGGEGIGKSYVMSPWGDFFTHQEIKDLIARVREFSGT